MCLEKYLMEKNTENTMETGIDYEVVHWDYLGFNVSYNLNSLNGFLSGDVFGTYHGGCLGGY